MKKVVVISDLHCGHLVGLTPPSWRSTGDSDHRVKVAAVQSAVWDFYAGEAEQLRGCDLLVVNGDAIDGKGEKSGGTEQLTMDRNAQVDIAVECISKFNAKKILMTYGTRYHVGADEDWEAQIADKLDCEIGGHETIDVDGVIFDVKHKVNSSVIPHGRYTAIARDALWNDLWAREDIQESARVLIRSHVHYFIYCGDHRHLNIITPALQGFGSKYGTRECSEIVNIGFVSFDVADGEFSWRPHLMTIKDTFKQKKHVL